VDGRGIKWMTRARGNFIETMRRTNQPRAHYVKQQEEPSDGPHKGTIHEDVNLRKGDNVTIQPNSSSKSLSEVERPHPLSPRASTQTRARTPLATRARSHARTTGPLAHVTPTSMHISIRSGASTSERARHNKRNNHTCSSLPLASVIRTRVLSYKGNVSSVHGLFPSIVVS
jgi:hypothetical protein